MNINFIGVAGRLAQDPTMAKLPDGTSIANFTIAFDVFKGKEKNAVFMKCDCFGGKAEAIAKYFRKGTPIFVQGNIGLNVWKRQDGTIAKDICIRVNDFSFTNERSQEAGKPTATAPKTNESVIAESGLEGFDVKDDDLPF